MVINCDEYADALYEIADEENKTSETFEILKTILAVLDENSELVTFLDSPAVPLKERINVIDEIFGESTYATNLLKMFTEKRSVKSYKKIVVRYSERFDVRHNIIRATAITAIPMNEDEIKLLSKKLSEKSGKNVIVSNIVDKTIIGGVTLRMNNMQADGSVKQKLIEIEKYLGVEYAVET